MPWGLERYERCGELHFVTFSCYDRLPYFAAASARDIFLVSLESIRRQYGLSVQGYVVMPEHVHLLVGLTTTASLEKVVEDLKALVAERLEKQPCWLGGYDDFKVHTDRDRMEKLLYMHRNPVKRGLAKAPRDWVWSSFVGCATGKQGLVELTV